MYDVVIVGGGPAGLSAALVLGRARRNVVVVDAGKPRNAASHHAHGVWTRDGTPPLELLAIARAQLAPYDTVQVRHDTVLSARVVGDRCLVALAGGALIEARRLLLATGVSDVVPPIDGAQELWGRGVHHCPFCDGWEVRDRPWAVYADGSDAMEFLPTVLGWTRNVTLCTDGPSRLSREERDRLVRHGVTIEETRLLRLRGDERLESIELVDGRILVCDALFVHPTIRSQSPIVAQLGCVLTDAGMIEIGPDHQTTVEGVFAAGDAASKVQQVVVAAAAGAAAAISMNHSLAVEEFARDTHASR
jgi:thioredoxin reductase